MLICEEQDLFAEHNFLNPELVGENVPSSTFRQVAPRPDGEAVPRLARTQEVPILSPEALCPIPLYV